MESFSQNPQDLRIKNPMMYYTHHKEYAVRTPGSTLVTAYIKKLHQFDDGKVNWLWFVLILTLSAWKICLRLSFTFWLTIVSQIKGKVLKTRGLRWHSFPLVFTNPLLGAIELRRIFSQKHTYALFCKTCATMAFTSDIGQRFLLEWRFCTNSWHHVDPKYSKKGNQFFCKD